MEDFGYQFALKKYDEAVQKAQNLTTKISNLTGFSGIIIAILSFIIGSNGIKEISTNKFFPELIIGIILLLCSIGVGIIVLTPNPKSKFKYTDAREFSKHIAMISDDDKTKIVTKIYHDLIDEKLTRNIRKAKCLFVGNIFILSGLTISFLSLILIVTNFSIPKP